MSNGDGKRPTGGVLIFPNGQPMRVNGADVEERDAFEPLTIHLGPFGQDGDLIPPRAVSPEVLERTKHAAHTVATWIKSHAAEHFAKMPTPTILDVAALLVGHVSQLENMVQQHASRLARLEKGRGLIR